LSPSILQTGHFPFSLQQAIQILLPLARALEHLHSYHLTHDDISLRTILCSNTNLPLLSAPGIRALLAVEGDTRKMQPYNNVRSGWGTFLGDPATIAPECIYGHPPTPESDIYSLGKVFLFFLTKAPVSSGQSFLHLANQHIHHPRPYPGLPEEAQELLSGMLASNPHQRISLKRIIDHCTSILSMKHQEELQR
jgi:serine/threonine protein kinase